MHATSRVCACISKDAIVKNVQQIRNAVDSSVGIMAVIKADGYGHGAVTMARYLDSCVDLYAVATVDEAAELREHNIEKPILVLGYSFEETYGEAIGHNVRLTVFSYSDAAAISKKAAEMKKTAKIHIAVDTGMGRIGFLPDNTSADTVAEISKLQNIEIEGVFTHFSTSDEADFTFTQLQAKRFTDFRKMLEERNVNVKHYHAANSGAIMQHREYAFDMVRAGIILYGLYPSDEVDRSSLDLVPVMELHSKVSYVKTVKKGDSVSYGRTFIADRDMTIATVPVGYADGYPRQLSNKGRVIINGKYAPITGRVCMDQFMVDVTDIEDVAAGTKVILIGKDGGCSVTADEIAALTGTINYEVVCGISKRVPREVVE